MNPKIMIIEDDAVIREVYALKFELEGYPIETAEHGQEALEKLDKYKPHFILLDMMMPIMDGLEFMKHYRDIKGPDTEVIVFSNISAPGQMETIMKLGASEYWVKSDYTPEQIVTNIAERWQRRQ